MKNLSISLLLAFFSLNNNVNAQNPNFLWVKQLGGLSEEIGRDIAVDANGNVLTIGEFNSTADFNPSDDPNTGTFNITSVGFQDIFVSKLDAFGNFLWAKQFGGAFTDRGRAIAFDPSGNIYITGNFSGTADFDPGPGTFNLISAGNEDVFICKLNASGDLIWVKRLGGTGSDIGYSIAVNAIGNVSTTGSFRNTPDFDPGPGTYPLTTIGANTTDIFVSTLDASGNFLWAKQLGGTRDDGSLSIAIDAGGNIYTTGYFAGTADFDPGSGIYNLVNMDIFTADIFVSKLDPSGNFVMAKQMSGTFNDYGRSITVDANGNIYTTGSFNGTTDFNPSPFGTYNLTSNSNGDVFVFKLDFNGDFVWAKQLGGVFSDEGNSIALDANGNVYTIGSFWETADFDPDPGNIETLMSAGQEDIFVSKLNNSGDFIWAVRMGGTIEDAGNALAVDANGNVFSTGFFFSTADFNPGNGTYNLSPVYSGGNFIYSDAFVEKLCQLANPTISIIGTTIFCQGDSVTLTASSENSYLWSNGATTQSIVVQSSGNYSVTVANTSGCTASSTVTTIIVNPLPTAKITPPLANISCSVPSATLTASGGGTYLWSNGLGTNPTVTVTPPSTITYTVTVTAAIGGCIDTENITVIVDNAPPTATISSVNPVVNCAAPSATLTASGGGTYSWSNDLGTNPTVTVTPASTTTYTVTVTATNGCIDTESVTVTADNAQPMASITPASANITCATPLATLAASGGGTYSWSHDLGTNPMVTVTPASTTTYTVTVMATNGCIDTESVTVTVNNASPTAAITPVDTSICQGNFVTLTASLANFYLWSTGATTQTITVSSSGSYAVTVTNENGCSASSPETSITVNPLPIIDLGADIIIQQGQDTVLEATGTGFTYEWSTGETTATITVTTIGTYSVTVMNSFGCKATDEVVVTVTTSIEDQNNKYKLIVSPNPAYEIIYIKCEGSSTSSVELTDNLGRLLLKNNSFTPDGAVRTLHIAEIPSGTYYIKVTGKGFSKTISIIKI